MPFFSHDFQRSEGCFALTPCVIGEKSDGGVTMVTTRWRYGSVHGQITVYLYKYQHKSVNIYFFYQKLADGLGVFKIKYS